MLVVGYQTYVYAPVITAVGDLTSILNHVIIKSLTRNRWLKYIQGCLTFRPIGPLGLNPFQLWLKPHLLTSDEARDLFTIETPSIKVVLQSSSTIFISLWFRDSCFLPSGQVRYLLSHMKAFDRHGIRIINKAPYMRY